MSNLITHAEVAAMGDGSPLWQNQRDPSMFSTDGGKTAYSVDDASRTPQPTQDHTQETPRDEHAG